MRSGLLAEVVVADSAHDIYTHILG